MAGLPLARRPFDILICVFYGVQIPIAGFLDSQSVLPEGWYPSQAVEANKWYIDTYKDPLVSTAPNWFRACGYFELLVQLPFFIVAVYAYALDRDWIRLPNLAFSAASTSLMIPIMSELILSTEKFEKPAVLAMYAPFAILPGIIACKTFQELNAKLKPRGQTHTKVA